MVAGTPTDEELAALTIVLAALRRDRGTPYAPKNPRIRGGWKSYWHSLRWPLFPGADSWRATLRR
nr:acyl-CoA carboxylase subunit epsilon [Propionibacterium sp.]